MLISVKFYRNMEIQELYSNYFSKTNSMGKFIVDLKRCAAKELQKIGYTQTEISIIIFGQKRNSRICTYLKEDVCPIIKENYKEWISNGLYPFSERTIVFEVPVHKSQMKYANKQGKVRRYITALKLVKL